MTDNRIAAFNRMVTTKATACPSEKDGARVRGLYANFVQLIPDHGHVALTVSGLPAVSAPVSVACP
jgi:hypothetical protein